MPRTINEGFADFLKQLTPSTYEIDAAARHRASVEECLKRNFGLFRFFRSGSLGNGTSISGFSDTDYFASIPTDRLKRSSGTTLTEVRDALNIRFPTSGVRVNCPAIKIPFGTIISETIEVVPADLVYATAENYYVYDIPDCDDGWMRSSPEAHNAYVAGIDKKLGGKVKPLIRFIKAWKYYTQVPVSSFYLEMQVARYASEETSMIYGYDITRVFSLLYNNGLAMMRDPIGITGYIVPCSTPAKLEETRSKLLTAFVRAENAWEAASKSEIKDAFYWWQSLYDQNFPSYYQ